MPHAIPAKRVLRMFLPSTSNSTKFSAREIQEAVIGRRRYDFIIVSSDTVAILKNKNIV